MHGATGDLVADSEFTLIVVVVDQTLFVNSKVANVDKHKAYRCEF